MMLQFLLTFISSLNKTIKDSCHFLPLCEIFHFENWIFSMKFNHFEKKIVFPLTWIENFKNRTRIEENIEQSVKSWSTENSQDPTFLILPSFSIFLPTLPPTGLELVVLHHCAVWANYESHQSTIKHLASWPINNLANGHVT